MMSLIVLSGGMDSTVALASSISDGIGDIETITFNYGSKHNDMENKSAKIISDYYGVKNTLVKLDFIAESFKSDLLKTGGEIPEGHYAAESMKSTVVPFRNGIMLAIAAGFAESIGAKRIVLGNHAGDHSIYPDCRPNFSASMSDAIRFGTCDEIELITPFVNKTKTDICMIGQSLEVPFHLTYSCYNGRDRHCGKCGTCFERIEAFRDSKISDPTFYE